MSEYEREEPTQTGGEEPGTRAGGDAETKGIKDAECAAEYQEYPDTDYRDGIGETLAGDSTKSGKP